MKNLILFLLLVSSQVTFAQLWSENFSGEANGATSGVAGGTSGGTWSVTTAPGGTFSRQNIFLLGPVFAINNTGTEGTWESNVLDISSVGYAIINVGVLTTGLGFTSSDYLRCYYSLDGGPEVLFSDINGSLFASTTEASAIVAGSSIQIIIRGVDNTGLGIIAFDNVSITAAPTIYSRKSGTWTDVTGGIGGTGTWSLTGHTGSACGCYPLNTQVAVIGNGHTVTLPASQTTIGTPPTTNLAPGAVDILNTGILQFNTNGVTLGIQQGLLRVRSGGAINSSSGAITGEQISFLADVGGARLQVDAGGSAAMEDLVLASGATNLHYLEGGGTVTITDDILINADNAVLTNNMTVTLSITDQIQFVAGTTNSGVVNNGTLNATSVFFDDINNSYTNNSNSTLSSGLSINGSADDGNRVTNSFGATLSILGSNSFLLGTADFTFSNAGIFNLSGTFANISPASSFVNQATGIWNWSLTPNSGYDTDVNTTLNCSAVGNIFNYTGNGNQNLVTVSYHHLGLTGSGIKSTQGDLDINGNLDISGTSELNVDTGDDNITISGSWSNSSLFREGSGTETVTFDGTGSQSISNSLGETFNRLVVNKSGGSLGLNNSIIIANTSGTGLTLTSGVINSSSAALVIINDNVTTNGGDADSFVDGPIQKIGNDAFTFPTGDGAVWARIAISVPTVSSTFTAQYFDAPYTDLSNDGSMSNVSGKEYWTLDRSGSGNATVQLFWESNARSEIDDISTTDLIVARYNGTDWVTAGRSAISSLPITTGSVTSNTVTSFSPFTFGSLGHPNNPLPIELVFFKASVSDNHVKLNWETASEINNDFFTIERSSDLEAFEQVLTQKGQGNSTQVSHYSALDRSPYLGRSYYRLKQTDYDGKFTYSDVVRVDVEPGALSMKVYAIPVRDKSVTVEIQGLGLYQEIPISIMNVQGQRVYETTLRANQNGVVLENFPFDQPAGMYILKAGRTMELTHKIMVE